MRLRARGVLLPMGCLMKQLNPSPITLRSILKIGAASLLAMAIAGMPVQLLAQSTNNPAATKTSTAVKQNSATKKKSAHPFHGNLAAVDKTAKTIKLGESVYQITSETKITKGGKPATLDDGVVGEPVSGYAKPTGDGKMAATSVRFGPKAQEQGTEKKKNTK